MIVVSICLSDLPKEKITEASNGKKYISIVVDQRKEVDKYNNTHVVYVNQSEEERKSKKPKKYVGNGKEYTFNNTQNSNTAQQPIQQSEEIEDLPF